MGGGATIIIAKPLVVKYNTFPLTTASPLKRVCAVAHSPIRSFGISLAFPHNKEPTANAKMHPFIMRNKVPPRATFVNVLGIINEAVCYVDCNRLTKLTHSLGGSNLSLLTAVNFTPSRRTVDVG